LVEGPPGNGPGRGTWLSWFVSFWPLQIGGWGLTFLVPLMLMVSGSITDPSKLCYGITRPVTGFLITLALRPCCSWALVRFGQRWLLVPGIFLVSLLVSYVELTGVDRLVLARGLPVVPKETWIGIFFIRVATFMIWQLLYIGIKSIYGDQAELTLGHTETAVGAQVSLPCFGTA
jgi:hypothetical protein